MSLLSVSCVVLPQLWLAWPHCSPLPLYQRTKVILSRLVLAQMRLLLLLGRVLHLNSGRPGSGCCNTSFSGKFNAFNVQRGKQWH